LFSTKPTSRCRSSPSLQHAGSHELVDLSVPFTKQQWRSCLPLVLAADTCALRTVPHVPPSAGVMSVVVSPLEAVEQMEGRRRGEGVERRCEQRRRRLLVGQRGDAQRQPIEAEIPALQGKNLPEDPLLEENLPVVALTWKAPSVRSAWVTIV
jgi:hypothetical protein